MSKDIIIHDGDNKEITYSDDALFNITSWGADMSFRELIMMYDENDLVKPELQRNYVWDINMASRFIESILLGLPVPSVFFANVAGDKKLIIDGYQRIMTVYDYVKKGVFSKTGEVFHLSTTKNLINEKWQGQTFSQLSVDDQRRIRGSTIHAIIFEQKKPANDTGMFQIFERINTGGQTLKPQEIRNCVYQGKFNSLIMELNKYPSWRTLFGSQKEDSRMLDVELILRFFLMRDIYRKDGFFKAQYTTHKQIALKKGLNEYMDIMNRADDNTLLEFKDVFKNTMDTICEYIGSDAFRNLKSKALQAPIFDAISQSFAFVHENKSNIVLEKERLKESHGKLLRSDDFQSFVRIRTTNIDRIFSRIDLALHLLFDASSESRG